MPAHAVGDDEDRGLGEEGVLVDLAHPPDVGGRAVVQLDPRHAGLRGPAGSVGPMSGDSEQGRGHRTLADQLRGWPDERLVRLLLERPDLATPAPHDSSQLASRAATRTSVLRTLDQLDRLELTVLDALVVTGQTPRGAVAPIVHAPAARVEAALDRLLDLALAWEPAGEVRALSAAAEALAPGPGTGASGVQPRSPEAPDAAEVERLLGELGEAARALLDHVDQHGGTATVGSNRTQVTPEDAATPAEELLARRLLVPRSGGVVHVPGEVGIVLRGGHTTREPVGEPPPLATSERRADLVDRAAAGAASEVVRRVELLLDHWGTAPPAELRNGGIGVRDLKAAAALLHVDEAEAALLVEVAAAAGLAATRADADGDPVWVPTDAFDTWSGRRARGALGGAGRRVARPAPRTGPGRHPRPQRPGPQRARVGPVRAHRPRDPSYDAGGAGLAASRRGARVGHRRAVGGGVGGLAAAAPSARP